MATITAGQSASFTLDAFGYITVSSVIAGTLTGVSLAQTLKSNIFVSKLARTVYGPYGVPMDFTIASTDGPLTYTTTAGVGVSSTSYLGTVADEDAMIALSAAVAGDEVYRSDTSSYWKLRETPYSTVANWDEIGATDAVLVQVPFSGAAVDTLHWVGPGRLMQIVLETGAVGTIEVIDQYAPSIGPTVASVTTTTSPETFLINSGAGAYCYAGMTSTIVGANSGYFVVRES